MITPAPTIPANTLIPLPCLVTGVAGVAGYNAFHYLRNKYPGQIIGIRQEENWRLQGDGIESCNAESRDGLQALFDKHGFRSVLDCAGNCALKACELDPELAWRINVEGVRNLLAAVIPARAKLVHLSVDLVYSGADGRGGYTEDVPPDPVTVYGKTMAAAEQLIAEIYPSALTLRISLPMGISFNGHAGAIDWIQSRFRKGRPATLYVDEVRTPTYTDCLSRLCEVLLSSSLSGIYHGGGPRRMNLYQIAQVINRVGGYDPRLLIGCPRVKAGPMPPRAGNVTMDCTKLRQALGFDPFDPWPLNAEHAPLDDAWHYARRADEAGSLALVSRVLYRNPAYPDTPLPETQAH